MRTTGSPHVQFVSKPIVSPFRDGSKCLVRDLCLHLSGMTPHVMGTGEPAPELGATVVSHSVYGSAGSYSPALVENMRAAWFLLARSRADLWHFVFAPNARSSAVGARLKKLRRVPTLQTIASPPRSFSEPEKLIFGDIAVAQSAWTRDSFLQSFEANGRAAPRIEVILPPAPDVPRPSEEEIRKARLGFGCHADEPLFLYPGDLEVSRGAETVLELSQRIRQTVPHARVVIAYRDKTPAAHECAARLTERADVEVVRFGCNVPHIHALVAGSTAIVFPVDDLYGKVDLPIVLLEAFRLGTPVLALDEGPLRSLEGALRLPSDNERWLAEMTRLAEGGQAVELLRDAGKKAVEEHYRPAIVAAKYQALYDDLLRAR